MPTGAQRPSALTAALCVGKLAPLHLNSGAGCALAHDSGNVLLLLLILLLCILGTHAQLSQTEPSAAKVKHRSRVSDPLLTAKPAQGTPSAENRILVNDTCADMLLTTPLHVKQHIGEMPML